MKIEGFLQKVHDNYFLFDVFVIFCEAPPRIHVLRMIRDSQVV